MARSDLQVLRAALGRTVLLLGVGRWQAWLLGALGSRVLASIVYEATVYDPVVLLRRDWGYGADSERWRQPFLRGER